MTYEQTRNIEKLNALAAVGDAVASYELGCMYLEGDGVATDGYRAVQLIKFAAEKGLVVAQCKLGEVFEAGYYCGNGDGDDDEWVDEDAHQAFEWYRKAAEAGDKFARLKLGDFYAEGHGVSVDLEAAAIWYELAANQGSTEAVWSLVKIYEEKYAQWLARAATEKGGNSVAAYLLGVRVDAGFDISGSWALSSDFYEQAANAGHCMAKIRLAAMFLDESEKGYKPAHAFKWLSLAAQDDSKGNQLAAVALKSLELTMTVDQLREGRQLLDQHSRTYPKASPVSY